MLHGEWGVVGRRLRQQWWGVGVMSWVMHALKSRTKVVYHLSIGTQHLDASVDEEVHLGVYCVLRSTT